jgi:hypothetical protein
MCNRENEAGYQLLIPSRFDLERRDHEQALRELDRLSGILVQGTQALGGLYMRIVTLIRESAMTPAECRKVLEKHFPESRISEILRVANAPDEIFRRYTAGFFGFRAALKQCRGYQLPDTAEIQQRKIKRTAARLVRLMNQGEIFVAGRVVSVSFSSQSA